MKIVRIIARLNVGGPTRHVVWLTKNLQTEGFSSTLIAGTVPEGEDDMSYFAAENGVEPVFIPELSRELSPQDIISLFKIYREIRRQKPDIVHTHTAKAGTVGRVAVLLYKWLTLGTLAGRPRRVKTIHTFHGHVFHSYYGVKKTKIFIYIERLLARFATDRIVVISDQQFKEINGLFGVGRSEQFEVIPLGIDLEKYTYSTDKRHTLRNEIGVADEMIVVGFVGRLTEIKNVPLLLDVIGLYKNLRDVYEVDMRFVIIGDGNMRVDLEADVKKRGLDDLVTFLGNRSDIPDLVAGLDILALTSKNEGTPLSLIEAMAAGIPVISTAVGGVCDLLGATQDEFDDFRVCERGIAIDSESPKCFLDGLIYLAKDEKLREGFIYNAAVFVNANYSVSHLVENIKTLYRKLV